LQSIHTACEGTDAAIDPGRSKHLKLMKPRSTYHRAALLTGAGFLQLLTATASAMQIVAASFGGCGTSSSASYVTIGTFDPAASSPTGGETLTCSPGPLASAFQPSLAGVPKTHLVPTAPGILTLMAVPDVPGWFWQQSDNLVTWTPTDEPTKNPVLINADQPRRFFRFVKP